MKIICVKFSLKLVFLFFYLFPLKSNKVSSLYQRTDGSGIPRGGVQLSTTGPPTKATVSFGTERKSSLSTENKKEKKIIKK